VQLFQQLIDATVEVMVQLQLALNGLVFEGMRVLLDSFKVLEQILAGLNLGLLL
jgi:hypothetical protein